MANEQNDSRLFNTIHKLSKLMGKTPKVLEPILPVKEIQCAEDIVNAMTEVEIALHGVTDSKVIGEKVMKTICDFYQAQYVGIMELDIDMDAWFPGWCIDAAGNSVDYLLTQSDYVLRVPTWYEAYRNNDVIVLEKIPEKEELAPEEMMFYKALGAEAFLGCPFYKRSKGFVAVMNPQRHLGQTALLRLLTYVLMMELNEYKMMQSLMARAKGYDIFEENEVRIDVLGDFKIRTVTGILTIDDFSTDEIEVLIWMALNPNKTYNAKNLNEQVWECLSAEDGQKARRALSRIRNHPKNLTGNPLIERTAAGYRFNSALNVISDVQMFDKLVKDSKEVSAPAIEKSILENLIFLYKGELQRTVKELHWMALIRHHYEAEYLKVLNRLLKIYLDDNEFVRLHEYANQSLVLAGNNTVAYYWKIMAYRKVGKFENAVRLEETAEKCLDKEVYEGLVVQLRN